MIIIWQPSKSYIIENFVCIAVLVRTIRINYVTSLMNYEWHKDFTSRVTFHNHQNCIRESNTMSRRVLVRDLMNFIDHRMLSYWHSVRWARPVNIYWKCKLFGRIQPLHWKSFLLVSFHLITPSYWLMGVTTLGWHDDTWFISSNDNMMTCEQWIV